MYQPIRFEREDFCPHCKKEQSLCLIDRNGNMYNYSDILDKKDYSVFDADKDKQPFSHFKCMNCGKEYVLDWSQGYPPRPMFANSYRTFMRNYKLTKKF